METHMAPMWTFGQHKTHKTHFSFWKKTHFLLHQDNVDTKIYVVTRWILIESLIYFQYVALGESLTLLTDPGQCQRLSTAGGAGGVQRGAGGTII